MKRIKADWCGLKSALIRINPQNPRPLPKALQSSIVNHKINLYQTLFADTDNACNHYRNNNRASKESAK